MATQVSKYKDRLQKSQQEKETEEVSFQVEEAEQQLQSDILATKKSAASKAKELNRLKDTFPLDSDAIIAAQVELEGLKDGLKRLEALKEELF